MMPELHGWICDHPVVVGVVCRALFDFRDCCCDDRPVLQFQTMTDAGAVDGDKRCYCCCGSSPVVGCHCCCCSY